MSAQRSTTAEPDASSPILDRLDREAAADTTLDEPAPRHVDRALYGPLREFLARPGKSIRAHLVSIGWRLGGGAGPTPQPLELLVEILHAGSLIVDDVEDDATVRRGAPSMHRIHGVPLAINAGNWLYFWALAQIEALGCRPEVEVALHRRCVSTLMRCHRGQALDVGVRVSALAASEVAAMVQAVTRAKTGALIGLAVSSGAIVAGAPAATVQALTVFGEELGVGLQMLDDLGGVVSRARAFKGREDARSGRPTWPWAWLAETLEPREFEVIRALSADVERHRAPVDVLLDAMRARLPADARQRVRGQLQGATSRLRDAVGESSALDAIATEIDRMERGYG